MAENEKNQLNIENENFDVIEDIEAEDAPAKDTTKVKEDISIDDLKFDDPQDDMSDFQPIDVSEPRAPVKEMEVIEEALAIRRREWIRTHLNYIYAGVGLIVVGLIVLGIYLYYQSTNPMSRFIGSLSKDFSTSFHYDVKVTDAEEFDLYATTTL